MNVEEKLSREKLEMLIPSQEDLERQTSTNSNVDPSSIAEGVEFGIDTYELSSIGLEDVGETSEITSGVTETVVDTAGEIASGVTETVVDTAGEITSGVTETVVDTAGEIASGVTETVVDTAGEIASGAAETVIDTAGEIVGGG